MTSLSKVEILAILNGRKQMNGKTDSCSEDYDNRARKTERMRKHKTQQLQHNHLFSCLERERH